MASSPYSVTTPKITPHGSPSPVAGSSTAGRRPDNTPDDDDRIETGPTPLAYAEWARRVSSALTCLPCVRSDIKG
jgi:hypothetical protein